MSHEHQQAADLRDERAPTSRATDAPTRVYGDDQFTVEWYAERCIHSGNCVRALREVFDTERRPWVDITAAPADEIERAVLSCPSGALRFVRRIGHDPSQGTHWPGASPDAATDLSQAERQDDRG